MRGDDCAQIGYATLKRHTIAYIMRISGITKIKLYVKGCYGCDRDGKFTPLHRFILHNSFPLNTLIVKRIETNRKWATEADALGKGLPAVEIDFNNAKSIALSYDEFLEKYRLVEKPKRKRKSSATTSGADERAPDAPTADSVG